MTDFSSLTPDRPLDQRHLCEKTKFILAFTGILLTVLVIKSEPNTLD